MAHRTVRCAHRQQPLPTATKWLGAINTPNHHILWHPSFQKITFNTRARAFNPKTHFQRSNPLQVSNSSQPLCDLRESVFVFICALVAWIAFLPSSLLF